MRTIRYILLALAMIPFSSQASPFVKGSITATGSIASASFFNEDYVVIGAGASYFLTPAVSVGLDVDYWAGGDPTIYEITPKLNYYFGDSSGYQPYAGVFYDRTFIDGFENRDAYGYRAGIIMPSGDNLYFGFGIVHRELQDCTESATVECSETYSEFSVVFSL